MRILLFVSIFSCFLSCSSRDSAEDVNAMDAIEFQQKAIQDSILAIPTLSNSPRAAYQATFLIPASGNATLDQFLDRVIRVGLSSDSLSGQYQNVEAAINHQKELFFDDYRLTFKEGLEEGWIDTTEMPASFSYEESVHMKTEYNHNGILTLGYEMYSYTGGAHGNYGTALQTIDLRKLRLLQWEDVFSVKKENKALGNLLNTAARAYLELENGEELATYLFEDQIEANDNFGLIEEGVLFVYVPYEIAPYAVGEVRLLIPYGQIQEMLRSAYRP